MTVITDLQTVSIEYTPAVVQFTDYDKFVENVEKAVAIYGTIDIEKNGIDEVKKAYTELNKLWEQLEGERKDIKKGINSPYNDFEDLYNGPANKLKIVRLGLKKQKDEYAEHEKEVRKNVVRSYFEKAIEKVFDETGIQLSIDTLDQTYTSDFLKAGDFKKDSFELTKKSIEKLDAIVLKELEILEKLISELNLIKETCKKRGFAPNSYVEHYENGATLAHVLGMIERDVEENMRLQDEIRAKKQAELERQKEIERLAKEQAESQIKAYDAETGEIIENSSAQDETDRAVEELLASDEKVYETVIKFTLTEAKAKEFREMLETANIEFEVIQKMKEVGNE